MKSQKKMKQPLVVTGQKKRLNKQPLKATFCAVGLLVFPCILQIFFPNM